MSKRYPFTIYNASAGSGKTFTLVKEYLKIVFNSNNLYTFKNILAITFTNKAVAEMKERIIDALRQFSSAAILEHPNSMFDIICEELKLKPKELHDKAKHVLNTVIHNYAAFDISTIDGFTHKLIRTFAHDLKLPLNFEVELEQDVLLNEAVNRLIAKAGADKTLTKTLVDFAIEKADNDKSWDVTFDFNKMAKLLVNENAIPFLQELKENTLKDFADLKTQLKNEIAYEESVIIKESQGILTLIEESGLEFNDFSGGYLPKHFKKLSDKKFDINFDAKWQEDIETKTLYPKRVTDSIASIINQIQPQIAHIFNKTKDSLFLLKFLNNLYKNITPISVLNAINNELNTLKTEQNKMLIAEFNTIISNEIKNQPTPFIYERLGEKFNHYFIDEFQDTSVMQWENLIPLISNSISSEGGSTMLVGDAKQAIYRWRGGKAEQFIGLVNDVNPFFIEKKIENLPTNYRSFKEIVSFNNKFFQFLSNNVFSKKAYKELYENVSQHAFKKENGYVELSFLKIEKDDNRDTIFSERVLEIIHRCLKKGFALSDICVLVRKKNEGVSIANYLSQNQIQIVSSETLLISNSPDVIFVNNILKLLVQPKNSEIKISILNHLTTLFNIKDKHTFFITHSNLSVYNLFKSFETYNVYINSDILVQLPLYDLVESIIRNFRLVEKSNAYMQYYLDIVLDFTQKKGSNISAFLTHFEKKKENLSIVLPKGLNAVQIMTIHKSKGLEFPVVIFPYADLDIYRELDPKVWFKLDKSKYKGFSHMLLNYNRDFRHYGKEGQYIYNDHQSELELDNINLLYVTLTRAIEQLYIISKRDITIKGEANTNKYSGLFISYLQHLGLWKDSQDTYTFGNFNKALQSPPTTKETLIQQEFISTSKEDHHIKVVTKSGGLWDTKQEESIEKGNLIHNIMAQIVIENDIDFAIQDFINTAIINNSQALVLRQIITDIVNHSKLKTYYNTNHKVYNEHDIISKDGIILRPDRVVVNSKNEAVIIDYKTGVENKKHEQQLQLYQDILEEMQIIVKKKILVYINNTIIVKEF